jgi:hypothetical protein
VALIRVFERKETNKHNSLRQRQQHYGIKLQPIFNVRSNKIRFTGAAVADSSQPIGVT